MKVILDLAKLLEEGKITEAEYNNLKTLASRGTETIFSSIFIGMGFIGASLTVVLMTHFSGYLIFLGLALLLGLLFARYSQQWLLLAAICVAHVSHIMFDLLLPLVLPMWWPALWG